MMKLFSLILSAFLFIAPFQSLYAATNNDGLTKIDGIAAIVDSSAILDSDIQERFDVVKNRVLGGIMTPNIRRQILNQLIDETLMANYATDVGMQVSSSEVDQAIQGVAKRMNLDLAGLKNALKQQGIDYSRYRAQIKKEILINDIKREIIRKRISITDQEINDYLAANADQTKDKDEVHLYQILIRAANPDEAKAKIEAIAKKIHSKKDFMNQAVANSDGQFAIEGGDLGWRPLNQLPPLFVKAIAGKKDGTLVGPLQSPAGFHLLWVDGKRSASQTIQQQTEVSHILLRSNAIRDEAQTKALAERLYKQLKDGADFATLAKKYSEDEGSTLQGGSLGWVSPGTMIPKFQQEMDETPVGQISHPFKTQFGWHILKVEARRKEDISQKVLQAKAREALIAQKQDAVLSNWLGELKADAFIDIKEGN
ncbi:peptidylprolyl isomerase [Marinomonas spartinae]|uniref:peptidylprolyl isomerase n=1 Tax=Marinomonas spartinae TaxID=1792290 RepID=UPI001F2A5750|nr:peptidylprolyl isomerase [Marinomonas spartinae]